MYEVHVGIGVTKRFGVYGSECKFECGFSLMRDIDFWWLFVGCVVSIFFYFFLFEFLECAHGFFPKDRFW